MVTRRTQRRTLRKHRKWLHTQGTPLTPVSSFRTNSSEAKGPAVPRSQESRKRTTFGTTEGPTLPFRLRGPEPPTLGSPVLLA